MDRMLTITRFDDRDVVLFDRPWSGPSANRGRRLLFDHLAADAGIVAQLVSAGNLGIERPPLPHRIEKLQKAVGFDADHVDELRVLGQHILR